MTIIDQLITQVLPVAESAHPVEICVGAHWTLVALRRRDGLCAGLSSTLSGSHGEHHQRGLPPVRQAGRLHTLSAPELVSLARAESPLEDSIGMAALNALIDIDEAACRDVNAADVLAGRGEGRNVVIVGHFPFVPELRKKAGRLSVLELQPGAGDLPASEAPRVLPEADVVGLTGTSLLNGTFEGLMKLCAPGAFVMLLGATTPLSPLFFEIGVSAVAGTRVVDIEAARLAVSQGATFKQIPGKRLLTLFDPQVG